MYLFLEVLVWFFILVILYTYLGYGLLLALIVKLRPRATDRSPSRLPGVTHIIPAFNEETYLHAKILNSLALDYPSDRYQVIVITDGSDDQSENIARSFEGITHLHVPERGGKVGALNRAAAFVTSDVIVVSDANTFLNIPAIRHLVQPFNDEGVGVVAGEKRIRNKDHDNAAGSGEGFYWRYESQLKKWDARLYSVMGAAGELFAVRTELWKPLAKDLILEDFYISLSLAMKGHRTDYAPDAIATEEASLTLGDELRRKIRISAGGFQAMWKLKGLLNIFRYGLLSFQYISHRVLRWTLAPAGLLIILVCSALLAFTGDPLYKWLFSLQMIFYFAALFGAIFHNRNVTFKIFFVPFYFTFMNFAVFIGFWKFLTRQQSSVWDKSRR